MPKGQTVDEVERERLREGHRLRAEDGGRGGRRVRPRRRAGSDDGVCNNGSAAAVAEGGKRRRGDRWSIGSRGSDYAKGVDSGRRVAAEGVEFGRRRAGAEIIYRLR